VLRFQNKKHLTPGKFVAVAVAVAVAKQLRVPPGPGGTRTIVPTGAGMRHCVTDPSIINGRNMSRWSQDKYQLEL